MQFVDQVRVLVRSGDGGRGAVAWRREKFVPKGGPAGGDGGRGGSVILQADEHLGTLLDLRYRQHLQAQSGQPGGSHDRNGRAGADLRVRVPVGTAVHLEGHQRGKGEAPPWVQPDAESSGLDNIYVTDDGTAVSPPASTRQAHVDVDARGRLLGDLTEHGQTLVVVRGGRGGRGNIHFRSSTNRAPEHAEPGEPGQALWIRLELKLLADVGIVGFPNAGKSTLISRISRARPKIGDYPFTTLVPQLGVVGLDRERTMVVADVPGLIPGASQGKGLGHDFLRHLERTKVLLHLLAPDPDPDREPVRDFEVIERELSGHGSVFEGRPRVVALNKLDVLQNEAARAELQRVRETFRRRGIPLFVISAHTGEGLEPLLEAVWRRLRRFSEGHGPKSDSPEHGGDLR